MKNITPYLVLAIALLTGSINAQKKSKLSLGDHAPPLNAFRWIKGDSIASLGNDQLYLIEFGATWCKPCIAAIPELSALQQEYKDRLKVISVFVQEPEAQEGKHIERVQNFANKRADIIKYSIAVDWPDARLDRAWLKAADLGGIPHVFIVDKSGIIKWIGGGPVGARQALTAIINDSEPIKEDANNYDPGKLLLINNNGGDQSDFFFRSLLTRWDGNIYGLGFDHVFSYHVFKPDTLWPEYRDKLELIGYPISRMYYLAYSDTLTNMVRWRHNNEYPDTVKMPYTKTTYGKAWPEPFIEATDTSIFRYSWNSTRNRFNYSLKVPKGMGWAKFLQATLRRDLNTYFGYTAIVETRQMPYWKITIADRKKVSSRLISKNQKLPLNISSRQEPYVFKNVDMRDIVTSLAMHFGHGTVNWNLLPQSDRGHFIDQTGLKEKIDYTFNPKWTLAESINYFESLGLSITKSTKPMKVVVIRD